MAGVIDEEQFADQIKRHRRAWRAGMFAFKECQRVNEMARKKLKWKRVWAARLYSANAGNPQQNYIPKYSHAASAAAEPSATAVVSWCTGFLRQSPATNTPGVFVRQSSPAAA